MAAGEWYREGTVEVTNGSKAITGTDTLWNTQVSVGDLFTLAGDVFYEVESVDSNTEITLKNAYQESSGSAQSYAIIRNFTSSVNASLAAKLSDLLNRWHTREDEWYDWHGGTVDGGPESDGRYPFTDAVGDEVLIACPAKLEALTLANVDDHNSASDAHSNLYSTTPTADTIPKADSDGLLDIRWMGLPLESAGAYGFRWNPDDDTKMELGSGNGSPVQDEMKRCLLKNADATRDDAVGDAGYLDADDSTLLDDGSDASSYIDGSNDHQVGVETPACYTAINVDHRGHFYFWMSENPLPGLSLDPAFFVGGGGAARDYRYMGAYQGVLYDHSQSAYIDTTGNKSDQDGAGNGIDTGNDWLGSVSGFLPLTDETRAEFRTLCENIGGQGVFWQQDYWLYRLMQLLYLTDGPVRSSGNPFNSQANIPGHTEESGFDYAYVQKSGFTNSLGNASGSIEGDLGSGGTGKIANSFRGIENYFGSIWKFVDGININDWLIWACQNPSNFDDDTTTNYSQIVDQFGNPVKLPESNDYQKYLWAGTLFPSALRGGSSTYITDYFYQSSGWRVVRFGGLLNYGSKAGVSYLSVSHSSTSDISGIGSRVAA